MPSDLIKELNFNAPSALKIEKMHTNFETCDLKSGNALLRPKPEGLDSNFDTESENYQAVTQDLDLLCSQIESKEMETAQLRKQLDLTLDGFEELQSDLADAQLIIAEQQDQLTYYRQQAAISKTNYEELKLRNMVRSCSLQEDAQEIERLIANYESLREEVETLRFQMRNTKDINKRLQCESEFLSKLASEKGNGTQMSTSKHKERKIHNQEKVSCASQVIQTNKVEHSPHPRRRRSCARYGGQANNINELPESNNADTISIKQLREEKNQWKEYALQLVRNLIDNNQPFVEMDEIGDRNPDSRRTEGEKRWYAYAMRLLAEAIARDGQQVSEFDRRLFKSMRRKHEVRAMEAIGCQAGTVQTATAMAQTRRRIIDRMREFIKKHMQNI